MTSPRYLLWMLLFSLAACGTNAPVPEDRFYQLQLDAPSVTVPTPVLRGGVRLDPVVADPLRGGRAVLYRDIRKPLELQRYHYEFWVDQPPRMVHQALLAYLRGSGVADALQDGSQRGDVEHRLQVRLLRFERLLGGDTPQVEVELEATLYSEPAGSVRWTAAYLQRQDNNGRGMHATAQAMQKALERIFRAMVADIAGLNTKP